MRCPKCQYLGFEPSPRCKNCGFDFSLDSEDMPRLTILPETGQEPMQDFDLRIADTPVRRTASFDLDDLLARGRAESTVVTPTPAPVHVQAKKPTMPAASARVKVPAPAAGPAPFTTELPLFMQVMSDSAATKPSLSEVDDRPLVQVPAVPRPPLAVRRTTPDPAKLRARYARAAEKTDTPSSNERDLLLGIDDTAAPSLAMTGAHRLSTEPTPHSLPAGWLQGVSAGKRLLAASVDGVLLASINAAIVWFTLTVCGMGPSQAHLLPLIPIGLFFVLVDGGYLVLFTAACGQTIGKMVAGIRVVGTTTGAVINDRITFGQAVGRSLGAIAMSLPLGVGFWWSLFGDGRALHDRFAHTRVVRA